MTTPLNPARLRTTRNTAFCWVLTTWAVRTSSAVRPNLVRAGRRDLSHRLAAPDQRSGIGLHAGTGFDGYGFAGEHGLVEQDFSGREFHIRGDYRAQGKPSPRRPAPVQPRVSSSTRRRGGRMR
jgi:hypothetical protein